MPETQIANGVSVSTPTPIILPYVLENQVLFEAGTWRGAENIDATYSKPIVQKLFKNTDWSERSENRYLFLKHEDGSPTSWVGWIQNEKYEDGVVKGDVIIVDFPFAVKMQLGRPKFGTSAQVGIGSYNQRTHEVLDGKFNNFSIVLNPAVKTAYFNNSEGRSMSEEVVSGVPVQAQVPVVSGIKAEDVISLIEKRLAEENSKREAIVKEEFRVKQEQELKKKVDDSEKLLNLKEKEILDAKALKDKEIADIKAKLDAAELKLKEPAPSIPRETTQQGADSMFQHNDTDAKMLDFMIKLKDGGFDIQ